MSYCEYADYYTETRRKARKHHKCCETGRIIQPGEFYWHCVSIYDGTATTYKQTEAAYHFARYINGIGTTRWNDNEDCVAFGEIRDHLCEMLGENRETDPLWLEWLRVCEGEVTRDTTTPAREKITP